MKRMIHMLICLTLLLGICPETACAAPAWPDQIGITAEGGIVIDADSGAVLYGQNIHQQYYPASITKILTALIIIEECDPDEVVTFSHNAVYNVESGSSNAGLDEGDQLTVRQCLYAMILKSANEAANALAEHMAGSIEAFSAVMNARAVSLGCRDSNFTNPSGLNDPNHYTSAYDMALISKAAFTNEIFVEIDSTLYYDLPPTKQNVDGLRIYPGHKMLKQNTAQYYPGAIGGKTGYTSLAGNTLVTCAERDGMKLIAVILNGHQTHYTDTKTLLDFGFANFRSVFISDFDTTYTAVENDMTIAGLPTAGLSVISVQTDRKITLPYGAEFTDADSAISYDLPDEAPVNAVAQVTYTYNDRVIGSAYLVLNKNEAAEPVAGVLAEIGTEAPESLTPEPAGLSDGPAAAAQNEKSAAKQLPAVPIPAIVWKILPAAAVLAVCTGGLAALKIHMEKKEEEERRIRYEKRRQRLKDIGMTESEFDLLMQRRQTEGISLAKKGRPAKRKNRKSFLDKKKQDSGL